MFLDGYSDNDIVFKWENQTSRIAIGEKVRSLPQYNLTDFQTEERHTKYVVGKTLFTIFKDYGEWDFCLIFFQLTYALSCIEFFS